MGVDLQGSNLECSFNWGSWRCMLELAGAFGWKPEGAIEVEHIEQSNSGPSFNSERLIVKPLKGNKRGDYYSNDGCIVTQSDAEALANALQRVLAHPEQPIVKNAVDFSETEETPFDPVEFRRWIANGMPGGKLTVYAITKLITLCRQGAFSIL